MIRRPDRHLVWVREESPMWDSDKERIIGGAPEGAFIVPFTLGDDLPGSGGRLGTLINVGL